MKKMILAILACAVCTCTGTKDEYAWLNKIRPEHPRMFINSEILETVKAKAAGQEQELFAKLKDIVDKNMASDKDIGYNVYEGMLPTTMLIYYGTGEQKYLDRSLQLFKDGTEYVVQCFKDRKPVSWFSFARIALYMGYDWLYDQLTPEERTNYGTMLLQNVLDMQNPEKESDRIQGENYFGFPGGGFYGTTNLFWYAGLACYGDGINDSLCAEFMKKGYGYQQQVMAHRKVTCGDDGGISAIALGYVTGAYPRAEWNFFHTWASAIGGNVAPQYDYLPMLTNWLDWNMITDRAPKEFGSGDVHHFDNKMGLNTLHLLQIIHFYRESHPQYAALAKYLMDLMPPDNYELFFWSGLYPFIVDMNVSGITGVGPTPSWPHARFFDYLGQVFMRSGTGADDTYCLFTCDADGAGHRHYDENNFIIYKKGYQAMDTGTRDHGSHTTEYYSRTVAHNCVTVRRPGEKFPHHWGNLPTMNDGGQMNQTGSVLKAFETNDYYTYLVSDATAAYDSGKVDNVVRQFLFVYPDHFVILDRVDADNAAYAKRWLLHTQNEPVVSGNVMRAEEGDGVIFSRTLLPADASLSLVGGPGKEFWVDGKNWPIKKGFLKKHPDALVGGWRLEVKPGTARKSDVFLHVLQTGLKGVQKADDAAVAGTDEGYAVTLKAGGKDVTVTFAKDDALTGTVKITEKGVVLAEQVFSKSVQDQAGLALKN